MQGSAVQTLSPAKRSTPGAALEVVAAGRALDAVVAGAAEELVVAGAAVDEIVAAEAVDRSLPPLPKSSWPASLPVRASSSVVPIERLDVVVDVVALARAAVAGLAVERDAIAALRSL